MPADTGLWRLDDRLVPDVQDEIRGVLVVRNERRRLPVVLGHHRNLGVRRFLAIDNGSDDGTVEYLLEQPDVHVFHTDASYEAARNGIDWVELLLHVYGRERWNVVIDADERLVYPACETQPLPAFCRELDQRGLNCLVTMFLDLYRSGPIVEAHIDDEGSAPHDLFFDTSGYWYFPVSGSTIPRIYGGPRARIFWPEVDLASVLQRAASYAERAFGEDEYLAQNPDVAAAVRTGQFPSGAEHFARHGRFEPRTIVVKDVEDWSEETYLSLHPDVATSVEAGVFASGLDHYVQFGQFEGRLFWSAGPPCMSQVPLIRWNRDMHLGIGRHGLQGSTWRRNDAIGGVLLHTKLMSDLVARGSTALARPQRTDWALENHRYRDGVSRHPALSAMAEHSALYRDSEQLRELGLITALPELHQVPEGRPIGPRRAIVHYDALTVTPSDVARRTLSVAVSTYNHVRYIGQALESVLAQKTASSFEVVVLDDCSTDGTSDIVRAYSRAFPNRVRAIVHGCNQGAIASALELLHEVRGEYVAWLEGDDYWSDRTKLQTQLTFLDTHPDYVLCGHNCVVRNEWTGGERLFVDWPEDLTLTTRQLIDFVMPTASMFFRNGLISEWPEALVAAGFGDRPLALMLSRLGSVRFLKRPMSVYRVHAGGTWSGRYIVDPYATVHETTEDGVRKLASYWDALREYLDHQHDDRISELVEWAHQEMDRLRARARTGAPASGAARSDG